MLIIDKKNHGKEKVSGMMLTEKKVLAIMRERAALCNKENKQLPLPEEKVNQIFAFFGKKFDTAFTSKNIDDEERAMNKKHWAEGVASVSDDMILLGLKKSANTGRSFAPNISEFLELCKPKYTDIGLPGPEETFQIISSNLHKKQKLDQSTLNYHIDKYKHPFFLVVSKICDKTNLNMMKTREAFEHIKWAHSRAINQILLDPGLMRWPDEMENNNNNLKLSKEKMSVPDSISKLNKIKKILWSKSE